MLCPQCAFAQARPVGAIQRSIQRWPTLMINRNQLYCHGFWQLRPTGLPVSNGGQHCHDGTGLGMGAGDVRTCWKPPERVGTGTSGRQRLRAASQRRAGCRGSSGIGWELVQTRWATGVRSLVGGGFGFRRGAGRCCAGSAGMRLRSRSHCNAAVLSQLRSRCTSWIAPPDSPASKSRQRPVERFSANDPRVPQRSSSREDRRWFGSPSNSVATCRVMAAQSDIVDWHRHWRGLGP